MSNQPPAPQPTQHHEDAAFHSQILHGLIEMANDIARGIHAQACTNAARQAEAASAALPPTPSPANDQSPDHTIAFDRIARTIRRTIMLARSLQNAPRQATAATAATAAHRRAAAKRILREVEDAIQKNAGPAEAEALAAELRDRLDAPDLIDDIDARPVAEIIADICRDLRVCVPYAGNWKRRTPAEAAALHATAAATATKAASIPATSPPARQPRPQPPTPRREPRLDFNEVMRQYAAITANSG